MAGAMTPVMRLRGVVLLAACVLALVPARAAWAGAPTEQLRGHVERVFKLLGDREMKKPEKSKERRMAMRAIANDIFDFTETAKRALGRHWAMRTQTERDEFVQLFADLLERSYIAKVELYGGETIKYTGDAIDGDHATVTTRILTRQGTEVPIQYRMLRRGERWLVYDVVIEAVSLVANYRSQFNKIIQTSSFEELVKKMKTRQGELGA